MLGYGGTEGSTLGGDSSGTAVPAYGLNSSSGAPGEGGRGAGLGKLPVGLPQKLLLLLL